MRVLMIAPPGAGKGTQGALIAAHFNIPHIATGELLRDHVARQTALGQAVQAYLDRGELVPDQIVLDMVREAMIAAKASGGGYVLDGIPRNMEQARAAYEIGLELGMTADVALHLQADDAELTRRLLARAALEHRSDDTAEVIAQRLALYHEVTSPIVAWYRDRGILICVDAMRSAQVVGREILAALEAMRPSLDHAPSRQRSLWTSPVSERRAARPAQPLPSPSEPTGSRRPRRRPGSGRPGAGLLPGAAGPELDPGHDGDDGHQHQGGEQEVHGEAEDGQGHDGDKDKGNDPKHGDRSPFRSKRLTVRDLAEAAPGSAGELRAGQ
jgi:adenylate kinase